MILVKDVMTPNPFVCQKETLFKDAIKLMGETGIGSLFIADEENKLKHIFTLKDILQVISKGSHLESKMSDIIKLLNKDKKIVITISPKDNLVTAMNLMNKNNISHLPVVEHKELVGVLSLRDIIKHFPAIVFIDPLTKISNRGYLDLLMNKIETSKTSLAVFMIDVDNFKKINDTYGHAFGDKVLIKIAQTLSKTLRTSDEIIRYGGEEFLTILYRCDEKLANKIAERILEKIRTIKFKEHKNISVTVSIGIAIKTNNNENIIDLIKKADNAMYKAKQLGKNRACLWEQEA